MSSALTAIKNHKPKLFRLVPWNKDTVNLDIGSGRTVWPTVFLARKGVTNFSYDPHWAPDTRVLLSEAYDTVTLSNVLNVLPTRKEIFDVLYLAKACLRNYGRLYIRCFHGDGSGRTKPTKLGYQQNKSIGRYVWMIERVFGKYCVRKYSGYLEVTKKP